jgi:hypothetical protein
VRTSRRPLVVGRCRCIEEFSGLEMRVVHFHNRCDIRCMVAEQTTRTACR